MSNTFFSPVGKIDTSSSRNVSPGKADIQLGRSDARVEAARGHQVLACSDDADASPAAFDELGETATPEKAGSLRVHAIQQRTVFERSAQLSSSVSTL